MAVTSETDVPNKTIEFFIDGVSVKKCASYFIALQFANQVKEGGTSITGDSATLKRIASTMAHHAQNSYNKGQLN